MRIWQTDNVVYVVHPVEEPEPVGDAMIAEVDRNMADLAKRYPKLAVFHDLTLTKSVDNIVLQRWADVGNRYRDKGTYVCLVPSAWLRTLVKTVAFIGRLDIKICKDIPEVTAFLAAQGFAFRYETQPQ